MIQLVFASCFTKTVENKGELAFGLKDGLPWGHIKQDMQNFKARTENTILIMGAKTFMSFPKPLKNRLHVVVASKDKPLPLTKDLSFAHTYITPSEFTDFLNGVHRNNLGHRDNADYSIIGGLGLITEAYPKVDKIVHTNIIKKHRVNSDVQLPSDLLMKMFFDRPRLETHWWNLDELTSISETVYGV